MQETGNNIQDVALRLTIQTGRDSLLFAVGAPKSDERYVVETYTNNQGISLAANLREAFNTSELLQSGYQKVLVLTDSPTLLVPINEYVESDAETLFNHAFTGMKGSVVEASVVHWANCVALIGVNKDLHTVVCDHFKEKQFIPIGQPVWHQAFQHCFTGNRNKLYAHFYGERMEIFCFSHNRFRFYNQFPSEHAHDALYYMLYAWKQLAFDEENDELHLMGTHQHSTWLKEKLSQYLRRVYHDTNASHTVLNSLYDK